MSNASSITTSTHFLKPSIQIFTSISPATCRSSYALSWCQNRCEEYGDLLTIWQFGRFFQFDCSAAYDTTQTILHSHSFLLVGWIRRDET